MNLIKERKRIYYGGRCVKDIVGLYEFAQH